MQNETLTDSISIAYLTFLGMEVHHFAADQEKSQRET